MLDYEIGKLYLAYDQDSVVAGALIAGFNKQAYYVLSSSSDIGLKKSAPDLIIWSSIVEHMKDGYSIFNLGGLAEDELGDSSVEEAGLYRFKQKYSAIVIPGYSGELILKPTNYYLFRFVKTIKERLKR